MSQNPIDPPVADTPTPSINLADYQDISGAPLSQSASIRTQTYVDADAETEDETEAETEPEPETQPVKQDGNGYDDAFGMASIILFSGVILAAVTYFVNEPLRMEHPHSMHEYF